MLYTVHKMITLEAELGDTYYSVVQFTSTPAQKKYNQELAGPAHRMSCGLKILQAYLSPN